jgi:hypothetical protein
LVVDKDVVLKKIKLGGVCDKALAPFNIHLLQIAVNYLIVVEVIQSFTDILKLKIINKHLQSGSNSLAIFILIDLLVSGFLWRYVRTQPCFQYGEMRAIEGPKSAQCPR